MCSLLNTCKSGDSLPLFLRNLPVRCYRTLLRGAYQIGSTMITDLIEAGGTASSQKLLKTEAG